jgi:glycosyltransferase involved in cell wall biosynthesis
MTNDRLVSVIMPSFNAASTIAESITSVLAQTHRQLELIVIDDGSTDGTAVVAAGTGDSRVKVVQTDRNGVSAARNRGLALAQGAFIKYLDSDDTINEVMLERQIARLLDSDDLCLCTSAWGRHFASRPDLQVVEAADWQDLDPISFLKLQLGGGGTMPVMTWLAPRALTDNVGAWPVGAQLYEDTEYLTRLALGARRILFCREARGYYRSGLTGSLSGKTDYKTLAVGLERTEHIAGLVLAHEDSPLTRRLLADFFRRYSIRALRTDSALVDRSEALVARYGGSGVLPSGGLPFALLQKLVGWRNAMSLKIRLGR